MFKYKIIFKSKNRMFNTDYLLLPFSFSGSRNTSSMVVASFHRQNSWHEELFANKKKVPLITWKFQKVSMKQKTFLNS